MSDVRFTEKGSIHFNITPHTLFFACKSGFFSLVKYLVNCNPLLLSDKHNLFECACICGHLEIAQWLLNDCGIGCSRTEKYDITFVDVCAGGQLNVAKWLLEIRPEIDIHYEEDGAFSYACEYGHLDVVKWLWDMCPDIDIRDADEYCFKCACRNGHLEIAKFLLEVCPDIDVCNEDNVAFTDACEYGHLEVAKWLLEIQPNINVCADDDWLFKQIVLFNDVSQELIEIATWLVSLYPHRYSINILNGSIISYEISKPLMVHNVVHKHVGELEMCPVCYDNKIDIETVSCKHSFCKSCIQKWINTGHETCPKCRNTLIYGFNSIFIVC